MLQFKAGYKFVAGAVHTQVLDFPAAITCGVTLDDARQSLTAALVDITVPRHREINDDTARGICRQRGIPPV